MYLYVSIFLSLSLSFSLSIHLSLSLSHTHTLSIHLSLSLSLSGSNRRARSRSASRGLTAKTILNLTCWVCGTNPLTLTERGKVIPLRGSQQHFQPFRSGGFVPGVRCKLVNVGAGTSPAG